MNNMKTFYIDHPNLRIEEAVKIIWKGNENKKNIWWQIIQLLPSSYNQTRNVMLNYEHELAGYLPFAGYIYDNVHLVKIPDPTHPFDNEIFILKHLNHPNVIKFKGLIEYKSDEYLLSSYSS